MSKKETSLQNLSETIQIRVEELRGLGIKDLDKIFMEEYLIQAGQLTDSRQQGTMNGQILPILQQTKGKLWNNTWNCLTEFLPMIRYKGSFLSYVRMNCRACW